MLNVLVDKAIQRSTPKQELQQPIFMISYSSIKPTARQAPENSNKTKTLAQKTPKNVKKDQNVLNKLKSKTLQMTRDRKNETKHAVSLTKENNSFLIKLISPPSQTNKNISSPEIEGRSQTIYLKRMIEDRSPNGEKSQNLSPFIINRKKITVNSSVIKQNKQIPLKSIYLQYKQDNKQMMNKNVGVRQSLQHKRIDPYQNKIVTVLPSHDDKNQQKNSRSRIESPKPSAQKNCNSSRNVSFINTIQYKSVPKEEIKHYKFERSQNAKNSTPEKNDKIFVRSKNKVAKKPQIPIMNQTISTLTNIKKQQQQKPKPEPKQRVSISKIGLRKILTEKRCRNNTQKITLEIAQVNQNNTIDSYRPWSPVKTNPLYIIEDDNLLEYQSKVFDIFSSIDFKNVARKHDLA